MAREVANFEEDVLQRSQDVPVLVDFWAPWCGPCRVLGPIVERLAAEAAGRWQMVKVNTDQHPELAAQYGIRSIPSVKLFYQGKVVDEFVGALPESEIRRWLKRTLPSTHESTLTRARALIAEGAYTHAVALLNPVIEDEPEHDGARVLLAEALFSTDPARTQELLRPIRADSHVADKAEALQTLARFLERAVNPDAFPHDGVRERYLEAIRSLKARDYAAALEAFIEVIGREREYDHGGAREACKAIFQYLGLRHPVADRYYNAFANALYS